jgi:hypothetical protein
VLDRSKGGTAHPSRVHGELGTGAPDEANEEVLTVLAKSKVTHPNVDFLALRRLCFRSR